MATKIAINGFGRIGRLLMRVAAHSADIDVVAINDLTDAHTLAHLFKYDSVHGIFDGEVTAQDDAIIIDGERVAITSEKDPSQLPWAKYNVEIVVEATGQFTRRDAAAKHLEAGAKRVIISAPGKEVDATFVMGINENDYDASQHQILSNASCTTNCLSPVAKVLLDNFGIVKGMMTTIHSYTNDQRILDLPHKDLRRARSAAMSMIPTTTGAAKAIALVLPELEGKLDGMAVRVPTPNVSLVDLVIETEKPTTIDEVNNAMKSAAHGPMAGVLEYCELPLVSTDFCDNPHSSIFDAASTNVIGGNMVKVLAWYDNEWGYANRVFDLARHISS